MTFDQDPRRLPFGRQTANGNGPGLLTRIAAVIGAIALLIVGAFFSVLLLGVALVVGAIVGGWLWFKTRKLRKQMREQMSQMQQQMAQASQTGRQDIPQEPSSPAGKGTVIDGDFIREADPDRQR